MIQCEGARGVSRCRGMGLEEPMAEKSGGGCGEGDDGERETEKTGNQGNDKADGRRKNPFRVGTGCGEYARQNHCGKNGVRKIFNKRNNARIFDWFTEKSKRQYTQEITQKSNQKDQEKERFVRHIIHPFQMV